MIKTVANLGFAAALALPAAAQAVTVTPHAGYVSVGALVTDLISGASDTQFNSDIWLATPNTLGTGASATVTGGNGDTITAHGSAYGFWASATAGTVHMRNFGWDYTGGAVGHAEVNQGTNWEYYFTPASDVVVTWNYDVHNAGASFGLWGFQLYVDGIGYGTTTDPYDPYSYGTLTFNLAGGLNHHLSLATNANIDAGGDFTSTMDGDFSWSIASAGVPEPASWAMLIAGFGMVGGAQRLSARARRRGSAAAQANMLLP